MQRIHANRRIAAQIPYTPTGIPPYQATRRIVNAIKEINGGKIPEDYHEYIGILPLAKIYLQVQSSLALRGGQRGGVRISEAFQQIWNDIKTKANVFSLENISNTVGDAMIALYNDPARMRRLKRNTLIGITLISLPYLPTAINFLTDMIPAGASLETIIATLMQLGLATAAAVKLAGAILNCAVSYYMTGKLIDVGEAVARRGTGAVVNQIIDKHNKADLLVEALIRKIETGEIRVARVAPQAGAPPVANRQAVEAAVMNVIADIAQNGNAVQAGNAGGPEAVIVQNIAVEAPEFVAAPVPVVVAPIIAPNNENITAAVQAVVGPNLAPVVVVPQVAAPAGDEPVLVPAGNIAAAGNGAVGNGAVGNGAAAGGRRRVRKAKTRKAKKSHKKSHKKTRRH
jgi:hypothetical protein